MATSEILLLEPIADLGSEGEQVKVRAGFARNYLFPRNKAVPVNRANKKQVEALLKAREARETKELEGANKILKKLDSITIAISVKTGKGGKIFGAVTAQNVIDRLSEEGIVLDKKQVSMAQASKTLGKHAARIKLHRDVVVDFEFEVVSENPIEENEAEA